MAEQPRIDAAIAATEHWLDYLEDLHARMARRFRRPEVRKRIRHYLAGLLAEIRRKNGWQMAEAIGETQPRGTQRILNGSCWNTDAVRDDLREYVVEHLGARDSGILIVDETGFLKKGEKSVGVGRRDTGTAGRGRTARSASLWPTLQRRALRWWIGSCTCLMSGPTTRTGERRPVYPRKCASPPKAS